MLVSVNRSMRRVRALSALFGFFMAGPMLAGCREETKEPAPLIRPVRTITVEQSKLGDSVSLTGHIEAENQVSFAFRLGGRMIERLANVGDNVEPGQILAKLDPQNEISALRTAQANLLPLKGSSSRRVTLLRDRKRCCGRVLRHAPSMMQHNRPCARRNRRSTVRKPSWTMPRIA